MEFGKRLFYIIFFLAPLPAMGAKPVPEEQDFARAFGDEEFVSIATGTRQLISRAPAVASVITANEIKAIGATDLDQVLETVPGLHVSNSPRLYDPLYTIRGIYTENNPQVLLLINDIPITNVYVGDRSQIWGGMPVNDIARIEIIRGPGSAVYGADAFAGTINIITKTASDLDGTEFGARAGSFDYREGWTLYGGQWKGFDVALSLQLLQTDGSDGLIQEDAQTSLDMLFGTSASLAPGPVSLQRDNIDTRIDISRGNWRFRAGYQGRQNLGTGAGVAQALDPQGKNDSDRYNADVTYEWSSLKNWDITAQASYFDTSAKSDLVLFPPGAFGGSFPNGMIGSPYVFERHARVGISGIYYGIEQHKLRSGIGVAQDDLYKTEEHKNFAPDFSPLGSVVDVSNDPNSVFIQPHSRDIVYAFLQDEWSFAPDWDLTAGVRYDNYSDFGDTVNPRLALVWQTRYNLTTKMLYGRAFRPPAFNELYNINNPVALGNPNLDPEKIDTYEVAFNYQYSDKLKTDLNLFKYQMSDIVRFVADPAPATTSTAQNTGGQKGYGLEFETKWQALPSLDIVGNYAFQHSVEEDTNADVPNAPQQQVYIRSDWRLSSESELHAQLNWVADRQLPVSYSGPNTGNYTTADLTWRYLPIRLNWEFALAVHNLTDADTREPSNTPQSIPYGLPLPGRNFFLEASYRFDSREHD